MRETGLSTCANIPLQPEREGTSPSPTIVPRPMSAATACAALDTAVGEVGGVEEAVELLRA